MLPGIGGALDLIDSLLFTAPLLFFYLRLVIRVRSTCMKRETRRRARRDRVDRRKRAQSGARHSGADGNRRAGGEDNATKLAAQANLVRPEAVCLVDETKIDELRAHLNYKPQIFSGEEGLREIACLTNADMVLVAVVGTGGLRPALAAIEAGKDLAVASKEILVMAGEAVMGAAAQKGRARSAGR